MSDVSHFRNVLSKLSGVLRREGNLGSVLRGAGMVMGIRIAGAGIAYGSQVLLARWMGPSEFGIYIYAWTWITLLALLAPIGLTISMVKFIAQYMATKDWGLIAGIIRWSRNFVAGTSLLIAAAGVLFVYLNQSWIAQHYITPFYIAFASLPVFALLALCSGMARGFGWLGLAYSPQYLVRAGLLIVVVGILVAFGSSATAVMVLAVAWLACIVALGAQILIFRRRIPHEVVQSAPAYKRPFWFRVSVSMFFIDAFSLILYNTDVVMVGMLLPPDRVAIYNAALRTATLVSFIHDGVVALAASRFSAMFAQNKRRELQSLVRGIILLTLCMSLGVAAVLIGFGHTILGLFGPEFQAGYPVLVVLIMGHLVLWSFASLGEVLNMTGNEKATAIVFGCAALVNLVLNAILIPRYGLIGAAFATATSMALITLPVMVLAWRRLGISLIGSGRP